MGENDKLLICIALILLITIVWTILIGIIYKIAEKNARVSKKRIVYDEDEDEEDNDEEDDEYLIEENLYESVPETKKTVKVASSKTNITKSVKKTNNNKTKRTTVLNPNKETYIAVRIAREKEDTVYLVPKNTTFQKGDKIKINVDNEIKNATVTRGNYRREKYKSKKVELLDFILEKK